MRKFVYVSEMLIVRHLGTPNSGFNGCHCMRDPVLYRSMVEILTVQCGNLDFCGGVDVSNSGGKLSFQVPF